MRRRQWRRQRCRQPSRQVAMGDVEQAVVHVPNTRLSSLSRRSRSRNRLDCRCRLGALVQNAVLSCHSFSSRSRAQTVPWQRHCHLASPRPTPLTSRRGSASAPISSHFTQVRRQLTCPSDCIATRIETQIEFRWLKFYINDTRTATEGGTVIGALSNDDAAA